MNDYKEYLNVAVIQENKPVTYKTLARSLGIHVNTAKQALYEFTTENQQTVHAVYCMTGTTVKNNQFNIQLANASELEETKKTFKQITGIHVYSVTSFEPNDFSILYPACKDIIKLTLEDRIKCGILKNVNVSFKTLGISRSVEAKKPVPVVSKPFAKATPAPVKSAAPVKRKGTLMFGPATTKKQAIETPKPKSKVEQNKPTPKPITIFNTKKSNQVEEKSDAEDIEMRLARTTIRPEDIFSDDEDEEEEKEQKPEEPEHEIIDLGDDDDFMEEAEDTKQNEASPPPEPVEPAPPGKAKRKVLKKKTTKNARGLLVTEEVWEWETVDEGEVAETKPVVATKPKAAAASKAAPKKNTKKGGPAQTDLFSFFKKK